MTPRVLPGLPPRLLAPEVARRALESVTFTRVLACIDFDALLQFEIELWSALEELGRPRPACLAEAQALVAGALRRLIDERAHVTDQSLDDADADDDTRPVA